MSSPLRPYQQAAIERFRDTPGHRLILAHATSAGKSRTAIGCALAIGAHRILVVVSGVGRLPWKREFEKWSETLEPHTIRFGRKRSGLSKKHLAERDAAYAADVQIVSYKLLKEVSNEPRDLLILDELHALRDPLSQQSKLVRAYFKAHPETPALGLTATPIPTEVRQLWCPLDTFWPGQWGRPQPTGDVSWEFQSRYCHREENEYGVRYTGSKDAKALADLAQRLLPFTHRVTDKEVAPYLPPLHASPLYLDEKRAETDLASEWVEEARASGASHICVVTYNRDLALDIATKLETEFVITGALSVEKRDQLFEKIRQQDSSVFVATCESIREAISLSFCSRALIFQWRTSPAQALQLMGRFPRQDAADLTKPTFIQYVVMPGDEARAELLSERIEDIQQVMQSDRKSEQLVEIFKPRELDESRLNMMFEKMMGSFRVNQANWDNVEDSVS